MFQFRYFLDHFILCARVHGGSVCCTSSPMFDFVSLSTGSHSGEPEVYPPLCIICISLKTQDAELQFVCFLAVSMSSLVKCPFKAFAHFLQGYSDFYC